MRRNPSPSFYHPLRVTFNFCFVAFPAPTRLGVLFVPAPAPVVSPAESQLGVPIPAAKIPGPDQPIPQTTGQQRQLIAVLRTIIKVNRNKALFPICLPLVKRALGIFTFGFYLVLRVSPSR